MTKVQYFPRYTQQENFSTNNTLLLLYQIYNENRFFFEKALGGLLQSTDTDAVTPLSLGLQITQQSGGAVTVPDGYLFQDPVKILIETKLKARDFGHKQLRGHFDAFKKNEVGWLILLSCDEPHIEEDIWHDLRAEAARKGVTILTLTFEDIIAALRLNLKPHNEKIEALVDDYEDFCSSQGLLSDDKWTLFAPPCGRSFEINKKYKLYFCPMEWSRRKARFLGIYNLKAVRLLGEISKIVYFDVDNKQVLNKKQEVTAEEMRRIIAAAGDFDLQGNDQFYLCNELVQCEFKKITQGGIMGHRYFKINDVLPGWKYLSLQALANDLSKKTWS